MLPLSLNGEVQHVMPDQLRDLKREERHANAVKGYVSTSKDLIVWLVLLSTLLAVT